MPAQFPLHSQQPAHIKSDIHIQVWKEMCRKHRKGRARVSVGHCLQIMVTELSDVTWPKVVNAEEARFCLPGRAVSVRMKTFAHHHLVSNSAD